MKRSKFWLVGLITLAIISFAALFFSGPLIKPLLELGIRNNGFPSANIESVTVIPNGLLLENISLDADSFSTIDAAQIRLSLYDLITKKRIESIDVKNIELTGEIDEQGQYIIAGWNASLSDNSSSEGSGLSIGSIDLNGLTLDFETPEGAIRIEGKLAIQTEADRSRNFQANLWGKQKQLSLNATAMGKINPDGQWQSDIELLETRIDMNNLKVSRAAGTLHLNSAAGGIAYQGKMAAGGVRIHDTPFQDFEVEFDAAKAQILNLKTSPTGHPGILLSGKILNETPLRLELNIAAKDLNDIISLLSLNSKDMVWLAKMDPLELSLSAPLSTLTAPQLAASWSLKAGPSGQTFNGNAIYDRVQNTISGAVDKVEISAPIIGEIFPLKEKNDVELTQGSATLEASFSSNLSGTPLKIAGNVSLDVKNIGGIWQDYPFNGLDGDIKLSQIFPWTIADDHTVSIKTVGTGVNLTNGTMTFTGSQAKGLSVKKASFDMAEGKLSISPFVWNPDKSQHSLSLNLEKISLNALASSATAKGFSADGKLDGTLPIVLSERGISFKDGTITSHTGGTFKYAPKTFPAALQGDDARMVTVRQALSDFRYSDLEIAVNGDLDGNLKTTLKASGKNPIFADRVINLNINLEGALVPALQQALQPGRIADRIEKSVTGAH